MADNHDPPGPIAPSSGVTFGAIPHLAPWFQIRQQERDALRQALTGEKRAALVALPGARGAGKSQLAADREHLLGTDHPDTHISRVNLAACRASKAGILRRDGLAEH